MSYSYLNTVFPKYEYSTQVESKLFNDINNNSTISKFNDVKGDDSKTNEYSYRKNDKDDKFYLSQQELIDDKYTVNEDNSNSELKTQQMKYYINRECENTNTRNNKKYNSKSYTCRKR